MNKILFIISLLISSQIISQSNSKSFISINYGFCGNFFVRQLDENNGPASKNYFYKKDFIGSTAGFDLGIKIKKNTYLNIGYNRSINYGEKNYSGTLNTAQVFIKSFRLSHIDNFYSLGLAKQIKKNKKTVLVELGGQLLLDKQQNIIIENGNNTIEIAETNYKDYNAIEAAVYLGFGLLFKIDTKFDFGIKSRVNYVVSAPSFESITLTPILKFNF